MKPSRWPFIAGALFAVLYVAGLFMDDGVPSSSSDHELEAFWRAGSHPELIVAGLITAVSAPILLWFAVSILGLLEAAGERTLGLVALASGIVYAALTVVGAGMVSTIPVAMQFEHVPAPSAEVARWLPAVAYSMLIEFGLVLVVAFIVATSVAVLRSQALPRWIGYLGLVAAVLSIATATVAPMVVAMLWFVVTSVVLVVSPPSRQAWREVSLPSPPIS